MSKGAGSRREASLCCFLSSNMDNYPVHTFQDQIKIFQAFSLLT